MSNELHSLNQNLAVSEAAQRRLFYQQKLDAEREDLSRAELALQQVQEKSGLIQPDAQGRAIIDAVATTRAQVAIKEVQLQAMRTYATDNNPDLKRAEQELAGLRAQLAKLERSTGELGNGNLEIPTRRLPEVELDYIRRARDLKYHEAALRIPEQTAGGGANRRSQGRRRGAGGRQGRRAGTEVQPPSPADRYW